jgi:hypothetical protein
MGAVRESRAGNAAAEAEVSVSPTSERLTRHSATTETRRDFMCGRLQALAVIKIVHTGQMNVPTI